MRLNLYASADGRDRLRRFSYASILVGVALVMAMGPPVAAHVELASSLPGDGSRLDATPEELRLDFTDTVELAGEGIRLIGPSGELSVSVEQVGETEFLLSPPAEMVAGDYAILWTVRAGDAHPREGAVSFAINSGSGEDTAGEAASVEDAIATAEPGSPSPAVSAVDELVAANEESTDSRLVTISRAIAMGGVLVAIGTLAFALYSFRGDEDELRATIFWVRRAGLVVAVASVIEFTAHAVGPLWTVGELASSALGVSLMLRLLGGLAVLFGVSSSRFVLETSPPPTPSGDVQIDVPATVNLDLRSVRLALVGVGVVAVSYLFDGHTVTAQPIWIVRGADLAHVIGAGVWVGGVLMLGRLLWGRWRLGVPLDAAGSAIRFSGVASIALAVVTVAGTALAVSILDSFDELWTTAWGRLLLAKLALVGVALAMGGYNHRYVVPALDRDPGDEARANLLRRVVTVEGAVLLAVVVATSLLVGAAS